ncbi:MAG: RNA polymerase sigma factor [Planctomycetes bacterium]|nr:RNA polymerase sigma factor [Planctomycetota bacterium]
MAHLASPSVLRRVPPDDLVQETFLRALSTGALPEGETDLYRYLVTVARHCVVDAARSIRARKRTAPEVPLRHGDWSRAGLHASQIAATTLGPLGRACAQEEADRLRDAFLRLDPDHRRVIGLRQLEGLSARQAAQRMGRSETAVHSLYRRALLAWEVAARECGGS